MKKNGFTLVEVLVALGVLMAFVSAIGLVSNLATRGIELSDKRTEGKRLAVEGEEAVMSVRSSNFLSLSSGTFHPVYSGGNWSLSQGAETLGSYTRKITLSTVLREISCVGGVCSIVEEGGVVDEGSFKVEVEVSWIQNGVTEKVVLDNLVTYWK